MIDFDDLNAEKSYTPSSRYCASKLANLLFNKELADRLKGEWQYSTPHCCITVDKSCLRLYQKPRLQSEVMQFR